jgi:hypothetical protein
VGTISRARVIALLVLGAALAACTPMPTDTREAIADWRSGKPDEACEIPGSASQWQADYCLAAVQTDDIVAAQPCLEHEQRRRLGEECAARRHYKQDWCRLLVRSHAREQTLAQCLADPEAAGPTVRSGSRD